MSDPNGTRPEDRVRRIEEETQELDRDLDRAREAVQRAHRADSMASPGDQDSFSSAEPQPEDVKRPAPDKAEPDAAEPDKAAPAGREKS